MAHCSKRIGLWSHLGGGNLGDDATLAAAIANIRSRWPGSTLIGLTMNPGDTQARHGIPSHPLRRQTWSLGAEQPPQVDTTAKQKLKRSLHKYRVLFGVMRAINAVFIRAPRGLLQEIGFLFRVLHVTQSLDLLVICGGGQLFDAWGGPWGFPYTLFKWVMLARLARVQCFILNVGAGPIRHPLSRFFIKRVLRAADYISFRDPDSRALVEQLGFTGRTELVADLVYSLPLEGLAPGRVPADTSKPTVGIAPMPYFDPRSIYTQDQRSHDSFISALASFGHWLQDHQYDVILFGTDLGIDPPSIRDVQGAMSSTSHASGGSRLEAPRITALPELFRQMRSMRYVVTTRFHGVIFAHLLNIPVIAVSHHPKLDTLMRELGLSQYCLNIHTCDHRSLTDTFTDLVRREAQIRDQMAAQLIRYRAALAAQFDSLFSPVEHSVPAFHAPEPQEAHLQ